MSFMDGEFTGMFNEVLGPLYNNAKVIEPVLTGTEDEPIVGVPNEYDCKAQRDELDKQRGTGTSTRDIDAMFLITVGSLAVTPKTGWQFEHDSTVYEIVTVDQDPAAATWVLGVAS